MERQENVSADLFSKSPAEVQQDLGKIAACDQDLCWAYLSPLYKDEKIWRWALRIAGFSDEETGQHVDDLRQDVAEKFKENAGEIVARNGWRSVCEWLTSVIRNTATDFMRAQAGGPKALSEVADDNAQDAVQNDGERLFRRIRGLPPSEFQDPGDRLAEMEQIQQLRQAVERVLATRSKRDREVIQRYRDEEGQQDIARAMGLSESNVNQICSRFRAQVKKSLKNGVEQ